LSHAAPHAGPAGHSIAHRALRWTGIAVGSLLAFVVVLVCVALIAVDLPCGRRLAVRELNATLAPMFKGRIVVESVGALGLNGVRNVDAYVQAADGSNVIVARGVRARIAPFALLRSLLGHGDLQIGVYDLDVKSVDVNVDSDDKGALKVAGAFDPATPKPVTPPDPKARGLLLEFPEVAVHHAWIHGHMAGAPPIDADLDDVLAAVRVPPAGMTIDVSRASLVTRGMPNGVDARGMLTGNLAMPSKTGADMGAGGTYDGTVGGIPATARGGIDGQRLDAVLDVPEVAAERVRALAPQAPIEQPVSAHVEAHGPLDGLAATVHAAVGPSRFDVTGEVAVTGRQSANLRLDAKHVDLRGFSPTGPASDLGLTTTVRAAADADGRFSGSYAIAVARGTVAANRVPEASLSGHFAQLAQGVSADLAGTIAEPGAPIDLHADLKEVGSAPVASFDVKTRIQRLSDFERVPGLGSGSAALHASGTVTVNESTTSFDTTAEVVAERVQRGAMQLDTARLEVRASGPVSDPSIATSLKAMGVRAGNYAYREVDASTDGSLSRQRVNASMASDKMSSLRIGATVGLAGPPRVDDVALDVTRGTSAMHARVEHVAMIGGGVDVIGAVITGVGAPTHATVHIRPDSIVVKSDSDGIDLQTVGYLAGLEGTLRKGRVGYVLDLTARRGGVEGTAVFDLDKACFSNLDGLSGHVDTTMKGRAMSGAVQLSADGVGTVHVDPLRVELAGDEPLEGASWSNASGDMQIKGEVDLAKLTGLFPANTIPVAKVGGRLDLDGHVARSKGSTAIPDLAMKIKTTRFRFASRRAPDVTAHRTVIVASPEWDEEGVDVDLAVETNGAAGTAKVDGRLYDDQGTLLTVAASSEAVPYAALAGGKGGLTDRLMRMPISAKVAMPKRDLAHLPDALKYEDAGGTLEFTLSMQGSAVAPKLDFKADARSVRFAGARKLAPLDASVTATYDGSIGDLTMSIRDSKRELLGAKARINAKVAELSEKGGDAAWDASASAKFEQFPLASVPQLSDRRVKGNVDGQLELTGIHKDARAKLDLAIVDLAVGKQTYGKGKITVGFDGHDVNADASFDQGAGSADLNADLPLKWGALFAPSPDPSRAAHGSLTAKKFRIGFLAPFIQSVVDALDGTVDADAHVALEPGKKPAMNGTVAWNDGVVGLAALGEDFHAVKAHVAFSDDGIVRLDQFSASGVVGKATMTASAKLDGTELVSAEAKMQILKKEALPLDLQGSELGSIYGDFGLKVTTTDNGRSMRVAVDVPTVNMKLPEASTHNVQDIEDFPPSEHVGVYASPQRFLTLPMDGQNSQAARDSASQANPLIVAVHIGRADIVRGTDIRIGLGGDLQASLAEKTTVTGQIALKGGKLDVEGKTFEVESGTVTFVSDPANPEIKVTAGWTAEDGTRVFADYVGPLKTGKVTLRSEPARPQNEIVALLVFGTADGSESTPYSAPPQDSDTKTAATVGGFATSGLTKGLDKLTGLDISAKIDTSEGNPKPEVEVQIARRISLELAVIIGQPPPGTNQDTTYATIDWRFKNNWSLQTTFGNLGSSIADVIWRRRY
jgi:translocation and assembly module TamB